jgi:rod shape determining protein RodA
VLLCVSLAALVYERVRRPFGLGQTVGLLGLGLAPAALVFLQPDLGTGIVLVAIAVTILFVSGIPWQHFAAIGAAVALIAGGAYLTGSAAGVHLLHGYQQDRLTAFLHPSDDPSDASYQVNQAVIAVGSGERSGRGDDATQTELLFLPERHTDFIFAVFGEEFGLIGAGVLLLLYLLLIGRAMVIAANASTLFARLVAGAITLMFFTYAFVNMAMVSGLLPVVGVPLPLVSYGGTAMISLFIGLGILMSVQAHRKLVAT